MKNNNIYDYIVKIWNYNLELDLKNSENVFGERFQDWSSEKKLIEKIK